MYQNVTTIKPLYLSEEEAMAILDLCLTSAVELDEVKERAVRKITDLARHYLRDTHRDEMIGDEMIGDEMIGNKMIDEGLHSVPTSSPIASAGEEDAKCVAPKHDEQGIFAESVRQLNGDTSMNMMQRAARRTHGSLWCMGTAIVGRRKYWQEPA